MIHDQTPFLVLPALRSPGGAGGAMGPAASSLPAAGPPATSTSSPALIAALNLRRAQVEVHGHDPAADDARDLLDLARLTDGPHRRLLESASLYRIELTRDYAVKLVALALAVAESCDRRLAGCAA